MRLVIALVLIGILLTPIVALAIDDAELVERLIAGSPWKGTITDAGAGRPVTWDMAFNKEGEKFVGVVSNISVPQARGSGYVKFLTVKNGVIEFTSSTGASSYELKYTDHGTLAGIGTTGRLKSDVKMTPATK